MPRGVYERKPVIERFFEKIEIDSISGCWIWLNSTTINGYGHMWTGSKTMVSHRFSYEYFVGPIPEGLELDHLCRTPLCVNPYHLEPVTHKENIRRGVTAEVNKIRGKNTTHCPRGHPYAGENLSLHKSKQIASGFKKACKICERLRAMNYRKRKKGEITPEARLEEPSSISNIVENPS